jgi:methylase of polypeptide subunit release factors
MSAVPRRPLFAVDDPADHARIRAVLRDAGYDGEHIAEVAGSDLTPLGARGLPVIVQRTRGGSALETLVRLFTAGVPVPRAAAERALSPQPPERWCTWGLLQADADTVRATVQLACHGDLVVATDWGPATPNVGTPPEYVMGFSPSSLTLSRLTVRRPARATLDLGTGCGLQGLLAAAHSERVVATDLNPRAVEMARFNAALNGVAHMRCIEGDMFEPVGDEHFDLVVSNPPFVVGPAHGHMFMSGGRDVDALCADLARSAPRHLNPGGWCQFLANWAVLRGEDWRERLARWVADADCDTWVIRRERQPADEYAALWIETDRDDAGEYAARFDEWMAYYDAHDVEAVDYGLVTMRRRGDGRPGRLRCDDLRGPWDQADGEAVAAAVERHDWLSRTDDTALLDARLRVADAARLSRELVAVRGDWVPVSASLRAEGAVAEPGGIDPHGERIVAACDGATPLRTLLQQLADTLGAPPAEVAPGGLRAVRNLVERGVLLPPGDGPA